MRRGGRSNDEEEGATRRSSNPENSSLDSADSSWHRSALERIGLDRGVSIAISEFADPSFQTRSPDSLPISSACPCNEPDPSFLPQTYISLFA